jgi:hypothetical protein
MITIELQTKAEQIIANCERELGRTLTRGERTDLLMNNTNWTYEACRCIANAIGMLKGERIAPHAFAPAGRIEFKSAGATRKR